VAEPTVLMTKTGSITRLTLNRPEKLNSLNKQLFEELTAALTTAERDDACRAIVLTGAGRAFCAGQDLSSEVYVKGGPQPDLGIVVERYNPLIEQMRALSKPIIGAINGVAAGAGASLAFACDIAIAKASATFIQAFGKIGLVPDCGSTYFLPRLVGNARARGLAMLAEPLPAEKAETWGLIWKAVSDERFDADVAEVASRLANGPTYCLGLQKQAFAASETNDLAAQLNLERDLQRHAAAAPDYEEGVGAFLERRAPKFTGRKS
jgi:2-(1,2-epoxy-1,2-dihydrophenyl)acetyl-CoA isomerase